MTAADVLDFVVAALTWFFDQVERFQILLTGLFALAAAAIAYRGATLPVREQRERDRIARRDRQLAYLLALDEALWDKNNCLRSLSLDLKKHIPSNVLAFIAFDLALFDGWLDTPAALQAYWEHIEHVPLGARTLLRRYAHDFLICQRKRKLVETGQEKMAVARWNEFVSDLGTALESGTKLREALAPTLERLLQVVPDHHAP